MRHWKSGIAIPSCALFLATIDPTGPIVQVMIAWGAELRILVSWAVMSVSEGPKDSLAVKLIPNSGASFSSQPRPSFPKESEAVRSATFIRPFALRYP